MWFSFKILSFLILYEENMYPVHNLHDHFSVPSLCFYVVFQGSAFFRMFH